MKKEYIIPRTFVVEVESCQLLASHSKYADEETTTDEQDNGSLLLGEPNN